ncbi:MAG: phenylacetate--CoA ligase family protein [Smithella sp.]|nr:phenylacetate--CoA ligase family protein [Smithella sp.]
MMENAKFLLYLFQSVIDVHISACLPAGLQRRLSEKRLIRSIRNAYENVPFYRRKYDEAGVDINTIRTADDIKRLPFVTKDEIRENFPQAIVARGVNVGACHYSATTGSTGRSLPFIFTKKTFAFYIATGVRMYTMIGYRPWHRMTYIKYTDLHYPRLGPFFQTTHIKSTIPVEEQIAQLRESRPDLIIGYASLVYEVARRATPEDLKVIRPKFIGINSELSTQDQRNFISETFGCPVYDEYSTEETWMVASQCRRHNYHIFTDNVWVEFIDSKGQEVKPGEMGEMVLTTTRSPAMPFIRYRIGDVGRYSAAECPCGLGFPLLEAFEGRADDCFILPSGKFVSSLKLLNTFTMYIKKYLHLLEEFKVTQVRSDLIVIKIIKGSQYNSAHLEELLADLRRLLDDSVSIKVEFVDAIEKSDGIKRKAIESLVGKGQK